MTIPDAKVSDERLAELIRTWERSSKAYLELAIEDPNNVVAEHIAALRELQSLRSEVERAFAVLGLYGVPRERARNVANGIEVLVQRMDREVCELRARVGEVEARNASLERDAGRYRWLRDQYRLMSPHMDGQHHWAPKMAAILKGPSVDAAIDAATEPSPGEE